MRVQPAGGFSPNRTNFARPAERDQGIVTGCSEELDNYAFVPCLSALQPTAEKHERELKNPSMASQGFHRDLG
jgi:hypothetical protein